MIYATGDWSVKEGRAVEFERAWQQLADEVALSHPGIVIRLLRSVENPHRLLSMSGPWRSLDELQALLDSDLFRDARTSMEPLLDGLVITNYELVLEVS